MHWLTLGHNWITMLKHTHSISQAQHWINVWQAMFCTWYDNLVFMAATYLDSSNDWHLKQKRDECCTQSPLQWDVGNSYLYRHYISTGWPKESKAASWDGEIQCALAAPCRTLWAWYKQASFKWPCVSVSKAASAHCIWACCHVLT